MTSQFDSGYPFTAIPNWVLRKQAEEGGWLSCTELSVLLTLQFFADGTNINKAVYPSYKTICAYANVSKRTAIDCIASLQEKGLIDKQERFDENGQRSNIYYLNLWNHERPVGRVQLVQGGCEKEHWGSAGAAPKQEPMNKKKPPYIPPAQQQLVPQAPPAPAAPTPQRRQSKFRATGELVPLKLQPIANQVCNFFNNHKGGQKTQQAFDGLISNLIRIADDPGGGIGQVKKQLDEAIARSEMGEKKWASITYSNWERFAKTSKPHWDQQNTRPATTEIVSKFKDDAPAMLML